MSQDHVAAALSDAKATLSKCIRCVPRELSNECLLRLQSLERALLEHERASNLRRVVAEAVQTAMATEFAARRAPLMGPFGAIREWLFGAKGS